VSESFPLALGMTEEELLKTTFFDLVHPEDREATAGQMAKMSAGGRSIDFENRYRKKNGTYINLLWKGSMSKEDGLVYGTATDITQKKEIEEKLIESKIEIEKAKAKETFLANMSHEIRTPLNAIAGFNELLSKTKLDHEQQKHVEIISSALKNLSVIINDILDLSKLENGKLELEKRPFNLAALLRQVVQMHVARVKAKKLKLILSLDSDLPDYVLVDETRLSQILINLLSNAVKFTSQGSIDIHVRELLREHENVLVRFSIRDTGIGIEPSKLDLIFERFTQAEDYTTRMYGGTGLGLNIVKSLVQLYKGELKVESEPGKGSEFSFEINFPISPEQISEKEEPAQNQQLLNLLNGIRVLLVEDNEHNQILAKTYLERNGAKVEIVGDGLIGLNTLKNGKFDVVLMDIQMPVMDGLETTRRIRKELMMKIPIVGCSAHALESEKNNCLEAGMDDYITKPYTERDLVNAISRQKSIVSPAKTSAVVTLSDQPEIDNLSESYGYWESHFGPDVALKLLHTLKERLPTDIMKIERFAQSGDCPQMEQISHMLAGSLGGLRLMQGMALSKVLEHASRKKNIELIKSTAQDLLDYLKRLSEDPKLK